MTDEEYGFTYQITSDYSFTIKIILPKFEPRDIIYLFFQYNENSSFSAGPIFDKIDLPLLSMNNIY